MEFEAVLKRTKQDEDLIKEMNEISVKEMERNSKFGRKSSNQTQDDDTWEPLVDLTDSGLSEEQNKVVRQLRSDERYAFSKSEDDTGDASGLKMDINLIDKTPVQQCYTSIPKPLYQEVKDYLLDLLAKGWIRKSKSSYSSPVVCRLKQIGIKLKPRKCELFKHKVRYLGHLVTPDGYCMDPADTEAVRSFKEKTPGTVGECIFTWRKLDATRLKWVSELADFRFKIYYKPGRQNKAADVLSRMMSYCTETMDPGLREKTFGWLPLVKKYVTLRTDCQRTQN
ncbi:uncharacterized protein [Argopecten irradians]|uniref:uncharacterized protein n=1 Tax=Argopecten irradians TaxID=31199 RepID=UPI0037198E04